jgi:hypothetical protein
VTRAPLDLAAPWARWAQAGVLVLFAGYQLAAFVASRAQAGSWLATDVAPIVRPAYWHFFTVARTEQVALHFEAHDGGMWREIPMDEWFPARWESGPRWNALGFGRDVGLAPLTRDERVASEQAFLQAACARSEQERTRLVLVRWAKTLGPPPPGAGPAGSPPPRPFTRVLATRRCRS